MEPLDKKAKSVKACQTCTKPFGITRIRHTCKRCNKIICADCTKGRIKIVTYDLKAPHKVCLACEKEHNFQVNFKTSNQTSWNTLSKIGQKWLAACNPKQKLSQSQEGYEESYRGYLEIVKNPYFSTQHEFFKMIDRDIEQGRLDRERTNYSFQEFLYHNQTKVSQEQIRTSMANVLKAFIIKFPEIGYCQGMNYICMFLLCLMDEESAFWMLGYVVMNVVPIHFYGQAEFGVPLVGFQQEKFVLSNLIKDHLNLDSDMAHKITTLLDVHGATLLAPLLANFTNFEVLFETWNKMLSSHHGMNEIRKVIIHMMKVFLPKMKQKSIINPVEFQIMVIRLFNTEEFQDAQKIVINDDDVRFLEAKFRGDHTNWQNHETKIHNALRRVMKFNKTQIKSLRERFDKLLGTRPRRSTSKLNMSMTEDPEGVAREDFRQLLTEVLSNDSDSKSLMASLDVDQLYDCLDSDKSGLLDFKEFLFLVSMMLKGSFEEKIQSAFYVFDSGDKGVLTSNEFDQFLQTLVQTTVQANQDNITPFFNQDLENFNLKMASVVGDKEKISFDMIKKELFNNNFIKYSEVIEKLGQQNENSSKRNTLKEADASILHTNQTYMDSTQDTNNITHHIPSKADDLTRILDQTNEQSTVYEIEESKFEDDKEEILTEAQKEEILRSPKGGILAEDEKEVSSFEPVKQEEKSTKAGVIEETRDSEENIIRKTSKVEYVTTASAKSLIERFNKNKKVESTMPPKRPETTKKVGHLDDSTSSKKLGGVQMDFEKLFENPVTGSDSLTSFSDSDHKPELSFNFEEDKHSHFHPLATMARKAFIPFGTNFLSPLSLTEVDSKPADISELTLSFLNNTNEFSPERHASVQLSVHIRKPVASDMYEALASDSIPQKAHLEGWHPDCFESNQILLPISQILSASTPVPKPFLDNNLFSLAPEQEFSEPPGLWKIDQQLEQGDKSVKPAELARPIRPVKKPIAENGASEGLLGSSISDAPVLETLKGKGFEQIDLGVKPAEQSSLLRPIKKPFAEMGQYNPLPSQNIVDRPTLDISEGKLFGFFNASDSVIAAPISSVVDKTSFAVKKPFQSQGGLTPLSHSYPEDASKFLEWKESCFEASEEHVKEMKGLKPMKHIRNPFAEGAYVALEADERQFEAPFLTSWKQDCFENFDKQPLKADIVSVLKQSKKPFAEGGCQPLPKHERLFDAPVLEGWKDDCFGPIERPTPQIKPSSPLHAMRKPFADGFYQALVQEQRVQDAPVLAGWKEDCFSSTEQLAVPLQQLPRPLKPLRKPFTGGVAEPLPQQIADITPKLTWKEDFFVASEITLTPMQPVHHSHSTAKPFDDGGCAPLPVHERPAEDSLLGGWKENWFQGDKSLSQHAELIQPLEHKKKPIEDSGVSGLLIQEQGHSEGSGLQAWKEDLFNTNEKAVAIMEIAQTLQASRKPFEDDGYQPLKPQERGNDQVSLMGWGEDCFEADNVAPAKSEAAHIIKRTRNPFSGGICEALPAHIRHFDDYVLDGWDCFNKVDVQAFPIEASYPVQSVKKPFAGEECQALEFSKANYSTPASFDTDMFQLFDKQPSLAVPVEKSLPLEKPIKGTGALLPMAPESKEKFVFQSDMSLFGGANQAARPHSVPSSVPVAIQVNKPVFSNVARHLEADKGDSEIIFIVDYVEAASEVSQVKAQTVAKTNENVRKVEKYLYGNHLEDHRPEEFQQYIEAKYPFFNNTDKALRPHDMVKYIEFVSRIALKDIGKEMRFEHVEEKKADESGTTIVVENSASGSHKSDDFEIVKDSPQEEAVKSAGQKVVYEDDEDDEETMGDSMFLNKTAIEQNKTIYGDMGESTGDNKLNEKRKKDALDIGTAQEKDSCKVCNQF